MRVFVRTARRFRSRSAGSGFCSCSHVVPHGPGAAGPIVRALFRSVCRKESGSYNSRAPRTTPAKCGSRRRNGSSRSSTWEGTKAARTTVFSTNRPAVSTRRRRPGTKRTLHRVADPRPRRASDEPYLKEFRTFAISELSDSLLILQDTKTHAATVFQENGRPLKGCDRSRHGCEQANPIDRWSVGYGHA